jgi:hypothetical protein
MSPLTMTMTMTMTVRNLVLARPLVWRGLLAFFPLDERLHPQTLRQHKHKQTVVQSGI